MRTSEQVIMQIQCKNLTANQVLASLERVHQRIPADTSVEFYELSDEAARVLVGQLPPWIKFVTVKNVSNEVKLLFTKHRKSLDAAESETEEIIILDDAPQTKRAKNPKKSTPADLSAFFPAPSDGKNQSSPVHIQKLRLHGEEAYEKQKEVLGIFIKDAKTYLRKEAEVKLELIAYRKRTDIPVENRILVTCCLAIQAFLEKDLLTFEAEFTELFILSTVDPTLFKILCCYLYFHKGELAKCHHLAPLIRKAFYDRKYSYLNSPETFSEMVVVDLTDAAADLENECKKFASLTPKAGNIKVLEELVSDFFILLKKLIGVDVLEKWCVGTMVSYIKIFIQHRRLDIASRISFRLLAFIPQSCVDIFADHCFEINYFSRINSDNSLPIAGIWADDFSCEEKERFAEKQMLLMDVVRYFSIANKEKVFLILKNNLETFLLKENLQDLLSNIQLNISQTGRDSLHDKITLNLQLMQIIHPDSTAKFFEEQINLFNKFPDLNCVEQKSRFDFIVRFFPPKIAATGLLADSLWTLHEHLPQPNNDLFEPVNYKYIRGEVAVIIGTGFAKRKFNSSIDWKIIAVEIFNWLSIHSISDGDEYPALQSNVILVLVNICEHYPLSFLDDGQKESLFNQMPERSMTDAELSMLILRCCFETSELFVDFVRKQIQIKRVKDESFLGLNKEEVNETFFVPARVMVLAPYIDTDVIEDLFDRIYQRIKQFETADLEYNSIPYFAQILTNLFYYLSPSKREAYLKSLSKKLCERMYKEEDSDRVSLTLDVIDLVDKSECHPSADLFEDILSGFPQFENDFNKLKFEHMLQALIALFRRNKFDINFILTCYLENKDIKPTPEEPDNKFVSGFATVISQFLRIAEEVDIQEKSAKKSELLESFKTIYLAMKADAETAKAYQLNETTKPHEQAYEEVIATFRFLPIARDVPRIQVSI